MTKEVESRLDPEQRSEWRQRGISFVLAVVIILAIASTGEKAPYLVIDAVSELLEYRVTRDVVAQFPATGASFDPPSGCNSDFDDTSRIIVLPHAGTVVRYRWAPDMVGIRLISSSGFAGRLLLIDGQRCDLPGDFSMILPMGQSALGPNSRPLPLAGPAEIGITFGAPAFPSGGMRESGLMHSGRVEVFGRAVWPPWEQGELYPTQNTGFPLPAGGKLTSGISLDSPEAAVAPAWYGVVSHGPRGLVISATTESDSLQLERPGVSGEAERFDLGLLTVIFHDPSVAFISVGFVLFAVLAEILPRSTGDVARSALTRLGRRIRRARHKETPSNETE